MQDWRSILRSLALAASVVGTVSLAHAECRTLLATKATWVDTTGATGTVLFQGTVEEGALSGRAYFGGGSELTVGGTVSTSGAVAGTLSEANGGQVATFAAQLNAQQELVGSLQVDGQFAGTWGAPADDLPTTP